VTNCSPKRLLGNRTEPQQLCTDNCWYCCNVQAMPEANTVEWRISSSNCHPDL